MVRLPVPGLSCRCAAPADFSIPRFLHAVNSWPVQLPHARLLGGRGDDL